MKPTALIGEQDPGRALQLERILKEEGCHVVRAADSATALDVYRKANGFQLVVVNADLPPMGGGPLCGAAASRSPVVVLYNQKETEPLQYYQMGAAVCLPLPIRPGAFGARIGRMLTREGVINSELSLPGLLLKADGHTAVVSGKEMQLPPRQYDLLYYLARHCGTVLTREQLIQNVWESDYAGGARTLDTHIKCLRAALGQEASRIRTVRKIGYAFN